MTKKVLCAFAACVAALSATAQESTDDILKLSVDARLDYQMNWTDWDPVKSNTGFEGKYLMIRLDGAIVPGLTYSWRQRLNKAHKDANYFDATDWIYLNYDLKNWSFAAGKQVVAIGGWEYDRAPIDLYGCSVFWNNIPCYQIGGSVAYHITPNDRLLVQMTQSPFFSSENRDMYAFNLMWNGKHGIFSSIYSTNLIQYAPGRWINYIALGNRFDFGKVALELDLMNRAASHQRFFFKDWSLMAELSYMPTERWKIHAKVTYDTNKSGTNADFTVLDGTDLKMVGGGLEYYPLRHKKHSLRVHAGFYYSWGTNSNAADVMQNKGALAMVGVKWTMDVLSLKRK